MFVTAGAGNWLDFEQIGNLCSVFVTAHTEEASDLRREIADALAEVGIDAEVRDDVVLVDGSRLDLPLVSRAHPTPAGLAALVEEGAGRPALVVADRISDPGRDVLRRADWSWLDRRGHLRLWVPGVRVETPFGSPTQRSRPSSSNPWTTVGLEIALAALIDPTEPLTARQLAPRIGRSVGAVHDLIARFTEIGLVGPSTRLPLLPELFWETAARWPDDDWIALGADIATATERLGVENVMRVDERAATLGGARIPAAGDLPARLYVRSTAAMRRARRLVDAGERTRCWVRQAPVEWLPDNPDHPPTDEHPWPVAHPLVCALRLASDPSRGREVVEAWGIVPGAEL